MKPTNVFLQMSLWKINLYEHQRLDFDWLTMSSPLPQVFQRVRFIKTGTKCTDPMGAVKIIDAHRGERGEGGTSCTPKKIFEKFSHKNAIKHDPPPPPIFSQPQVPPQKNLPKITQGPPYWISNYCASILKIMGLLEALNGKNMFLLFAGFIYYYLEFSSCQKKSTRR
jgi:hypothetical protein